MKKTIGISCLVAGVALFLFGSHLAGQAAQGEAAISAAEANQGHRPIVGPVRRAARNQEEMAGEQKISGEGRLIAATETNSQWLHGAGMLLLLIGVGYLICLKD